MVSFKNIELNVESSHELKQKMPSKKDILPCKNYTTRPLSLIGEYENLNCH